MKTIAYMRGILIVSLIFPISVMAIYESGEAYPKNVYWGDTHLHTNLSYDASLLSGNVLGPESAYRFAKGDVTLGDIAIVRSEALQLILVSERTLAGGPSLFRELGIEPNSKDYFIFKYAHDSDYPIEVFGTTLDYKSWPSDRITRPKYPWDSEPFV